MNYKSYPLNDLCAYIFTLYFMNVALLVVFEVSDNR